MAPFYRGFTTDVKLASDDIEAIQELYGKKTNECVEIREPLKWSNGPDWFVGGCENFRPFRLS